MNSFWLIGLFAAVSVQASVAENIVNAMGGSSDFLLSLYYVVGLAFIFNGVNKLKKLGHRTAFMNVDSGIVGPVSQMVLGGCLIYIPSFFTVINTSIWGSPSFAAATDLAYLADSDNLLEAMRPIIMVIQFVGLIALLRGFLILTKATGQGAQPGTVSKGFVHIFGGILAVNIVRTVELVVNTFGAG